MLTRPYESKNGHKNNTNATSNCADSPVYGIIDVLFICASSFMSKMERVATKMYIIKHVRVFVGLCLT